MIFCLAASSVYAFNDARDAREDRAHPVKRHRPVAAGRISTRHATWTAVFLAAGALGTAWAAAPGAWTWIGAYLALNVAYSLGLKHVVLLDVFAIASFFVLRLLAGAGAVEVHPSVWLLLCGGFGELEHFTRVAEGRAPFESLWSHHFLDGLKKS